MDLGLQGKVAVITGGSEGIGKAAAWRVVAEGGNVAIVGRTQAKLDAAAREIRQRTGREVLTVAADVSLPESPRRIVDAALARFGAVDILVNNAGTGAAGSFEATSDEAWTADFNLKVFPAIRLIRLCVPLMRQRGGGRIINVTNIGARAPGASSVPTSVSRAAGIAITKALSKEFARDNILVNTVCIGYIKSGQHETRFAREVRAKDPGARIEDYYASVAKVRGVPLGRVGEAEEAGDVIAFLVSGRASYLTGIAVNIDGGASPVV